MANKKTAAPMMRVGASSWVYDKKKGLALKSGRVEVVEVELDPDKPWKNLTRYEAHAREGVLFVRRGGSENREYSQATLLLSSGSESSVWSGLAVSICYHVGRSCFLLERSHTRPDAVEHSWFSDFEDAVSAAQGRLVPYGLSSKKGSR